MHIYGIHWREWDRGLNLYALTQNATHETEKEDLPNLKQLNILNFLKETGIVGLIGTNLVNGEEYQFKIWIYALTIVVGDVVCQVWGTLQNCS